MRIAVIGGGPGGLYFSALARRHGIAREITVWERNAPSETFGFGVVLSDQALDAIELADPALLPAMRPMLARWDDIDVHYRGTAFTAGGNGFAAMSRTGLLTVLQRRCAELGVPVRYGSEITDVDALAAGHDVVVAADGVNSPSRARYAETFRPTVQTGRCRYIWLGTDLALDSFKFYVVDTPGGAVQVHAYPDSGQSSTLIVELSEDAWRAAGFADAAAAQLPPGESDERSIGIIAELCKDILDGHELSGNNSRWLRFPTVRCETWRHRNVVLLGDAAHTAHFSIGSGTKLAMDDASALAGSLREQPDAEAALAAYEAARRPAVGSLQRAARASREWFEGIDRYTHQHPQQFAVNLLTRSRRVSYAGMRRRDPGFVARAERWFARAAGGRPGPPMLQPCTLGGLELANRVVVAPGEARPVRDGVPGDLHLVHLGGAALRGAGLMLAGPVAVSAEGAAATGGAGLYTGEQAAEWRRIARFVHANSRAKIGVQLGYYGPDGAAVPLADLQRAFAAAARRAAAVFDLLELDWADDRRLSPLPSPPAGEPGGNGGAPRDRLRYPLGVLDAIRAEWPAERPVSVRISPAGRYPGGDGADALAETANELAARGATAVHVTSGTRAGGDVYADRIRNQAGRRSGFAVIAEGSISAADVDTIVLAGHADLCVVDRQAEDSLRPAPCGTPDQSLLKEPS
ncbi:oxidoreductase [Actinomadura livida]|uniref:Anthraniloyl-CoA monooxygenase n=1 Tax=Actinomadura livida TaxID=79909 RepID=A0A7W7ICP1_9ACTN|nr:MULTISPECIES: FAD-dependent monooxygenase [Actinomadura]MBB4774669.1 anthraniloyl-CoA monooxygenase [Actinomadura catellatispora]